MAFPPGRRALWLAVAVAIAIGLTLGWCVRSRTAPTPQSRARDAAEELRERARELTH